MKSTLKLCLLLCLTLTSASFADHFYSIADQNCTDTRQFPTVPAQCKCIMTNAIEDCLAKSPIKPVCTAPTLDNLFKTNPNLAMVECVEYGGTPDQCRWSVTFYNANQCTPVSNK